MPAMMHDDGSCPMSVLDFKEMVAACPGEMWLIYYCPKCSAFYIADRDYEPIDSDAGGG